MASAVVARNGPKGAEYLFHDKGRPAWAASAEAAERYLSFRDATREALRLPSAMRAFALPAAPGETLSA